MNISQNFVEGWDVIRKVFWLTPENCLIWEKDTALSKSFWLAISDLKGSKFEHSLLKDIYFQQLHQMWGFSLDQGLIPRLPRADKVSASDQNR